MMQCILMNVMVLKNLQLIEGGNIQFESKFLEYH